MTSAQRDHMTLGALHERNARDRGGCEALVFEDRRLTFAEYHDRCQKLAAALYDLGVARQDRVMFLSMNSLTPYETFGACEIAGFIAAPLNFRLAPPEMLHILADAAPKVLIFQQQYAAVVAGLRERAPQDLRYVCVEGGLDWALDYEALIASGSGGGPPVRARRGDYAHLFYTSGTTGRPKGVVHTHEAACQWAPATALVSEFDASSRVLQTSPAFHTGGKGYVVAAHWVGGAAVVRNGFDALKVLQTIERERITFTFMVGAMVEAVLAVPGVERYDLSSLRKVISAAAPIPTPLLRRAIDLLGPVFAVQYGSTEAGNIGNLWRHEVVIDGPPEQVRRLASVGRPIPGIELRILDDQGRDCPTGQPGEVVVRSPALAARYWNNDVATAEAFRDGWYYTGDVGQRDEEGYLFLVDRKKDMIISGGENIYSREVEDAVLQHPEVQNAAVIGVPDPRWGEAVCAVVARRPGAQLTEAALIAHTRTLIAGYKTPKLVHWVDELPYLPSGKIDKVELRRRYARPQAAPAAAES